MATPALSRSANLSREETAERSARVRVDSIDVNVDLRYARDVDIDTFETASTLKFSASTTHTWLDFIGAAVDEVVVNGRAQPVDWDGARIRVEGLVAENTVTVRGRARFSRSGEGLHRFVDPVDAEVYLYTQYEPADARRVYACFEQPDLKARWKFNVSAEPAWVVLSNGVEESRTTIDGGVRVSFAQTLPLSSYITAIAAGPYHRVDARAGGIDLGVLCRASLAQHLDADEIIDITRSGLEYFTESFGSDYPWGKYDQVFVPEYNLGAMENPGLVTFTEAYIFRGASTHAQHEARANTILHEMAHMWFGDLVTMRWWDDLWLKESFADFMGSHVAASAGGFPDAWVSFASRRKGWAYEQDQLPTTHPIVAEIDDLEAAKLNFDGITYAKGASVLKQLVAFVGEAAFFRGAQRYFADHAFGNTTLDDLLVALEAASGRDLRTWSQSWLQSTGVPLLQVERAPELRVIQSDARPHRLSLGFYVERDGRLIRHAGTEVDIAAESTPIDTSVLPDADLIVPNDDDRTYAKVRLDSRSTDAVARSLSTIDDALVRSVVWASLWNAVRDAEMSVARYLDIVTRHAPAEPSVALLSDAIAHTGFAITHYSTDDDRSRMRSSWMDATWRAMHAAAPGSDAQLAWARAVAGAAAACDDRSAELRDILRGQATAPEGLALDADLRWGWWVALAASGRATPDDADQALASDPTATGRLAYRTMVSAWPDAAVRESAWHAAWADESLSNDELDATIAGIRAGARRDLIAGLDDDYYARILEVWNTRSIEIARRLVRGLFPASESLEGADRWLSAHSDAPAALRRLLIEQRDGLARALRVQRAQTIAD